MSPRVQVQHQYSQPVTNFMNSGFPISSGSSCPTTAGQGIRSEHCDQQSKNSVFSNALSSPVRQSLQHYHITRGGYCPSGGLPLGNGTRNNEPTIINNQSRDSSALSLSSNDSAMDMHADSPAHEFIYWYFAHFTSPLPWSSTVQDLGRIMVTWSSFVRFHKKWKHWMEMIPWPLNLLLLLSLKIDLGLLYLL